MQKSGILFVIVGGIIGLGIILSFYGNQVIFEGLIKGDGQIKLGKNLVIPIEFNNIQTQNGIYAIQIIDFKKGVTVKILDPFDKEIKSQTINQEVFEGQFKIEEQGTYKLVIENSDENEIKVFGVIGLEPDAGKKSLVLISPWILVIGMAGMVIVTIYVIKNRKKSFS